MFIFDITLFKNKYVKLALKKIFGINKFFVNKIINKLGFACNLKVFNLNNNQILNLTLVINNLALLISNDLKKQKFLIFNKLINIKTVKINRLLNGLPIRGQRTHTNAKTAKKIKHILK